MNNTTPTQVKTINIQGNEYVTVAERVRIAHESKTLESVVTEIISHDPVVIRAVVTIAGKDFTGISAANPNKAIEKASPYEVAETSAVGRALGFAGFGAIDSIASADEVLVAQNAAMKVKIAAKPVIGSQVPASGGEKCVYCQSWCTPAVIEYGSNHHHLIKPLCFSCQKHPERIAMYVSETAPPGEEAGFDDLFEINN